MRTIDIHVLISEEAYIRLQSGKSIAGLMKKDLATDVNTFTDWKKKKKSRKSFKETKIGDVDYGFVTKTDMHIMRHERFPLSLGLSGIQSAMSRDNKQSLGIVYDELNDNL